MISDQAIKSIKDIESLLEFLRYELDWPIEDEELETLTYEYYPDELGLDAQYENMISSIKQLRPLVDNQPWGIFFLDFEKKSLPVGALRKILSGLVFSKRRNTEHAVWDKSELLFICSLKYEENLVISFVHFKDSNSSIPSINTVYWDVNKETNFNFKKELENLAWPSDMSKTEKWKREWSSAFTTVYKENIVQSRQLVEKLAMLAQNTRQRVLETYFVENANGELHKLYKRFQELLIHDLSISDFADMYAQTVAYGLFSARCMDTDGHFELSEVVDRIPTTNPFLKQLLKNCFEHGLGSSKSLMFDELAIGEIVDLLDHIDTDKILDDFGRQTGGGTEDPVIHFYEGFLDAYEHEQKKRRGVYYTPDPVVSFIVHSVDEILRDDFGYDDGLADISTKTIEYKRKSKKQKPGTQTKYVIDTKEVPAIQILDPATGTGTFLAHTIRQIKANFDRKHQDKSADEVKQLWNEYVPKHLLPRINGFEIMMAPYSVAHMKLGLVLKETGYDFYEQDRLNVYLTNTLEEAGSEEITLFDILSDEAAGANKIKNNKGINIVIGNPPYSGLSQNMNSWIDGLLKGKLPNGNQVSSYYKIEGKTLGEKKVWLQDDYVKFIRYGQFLLEQIDNPAILAFITNNGYLGNPTFRGMRESLLQTFDEIYVIDLHGNSKKKECSPDGSKDENVFDIQQGVSIGMFLKHSEASKTAKVHHLDVWGSRETKYDFLREVSIRDINWEEIAPGSPFYLFVPQDTTYEAEYNQGWKLNEIMPVNCAGIITSRDKFVIDYEDDPIRSRINLFQKIDEISDDQILKEFRLSETRGWKIHAARKNFSELKDWEKYITDILYRPFDFRRILYHPIMVDWPRPQVMGNMLQNNIALISARSNKSNTPDHFLCTKLMSEAKCGEYTTQSTHFPLYIYSVEKKGVVNSNFTKEFINQLERKLQLRFLPEHKGDLKTTFGPYDVFSYIYSIFYAESYRNRYAEFLKMDFPRIPITSNNMLFRELSSLGERLVKLHLMEITLSLLTEYQSQGDNKVERIKYIPEIRMNSKSSIQIFGRVYINNHQFFAGIPEEVWNFKIGGYQVCHKWLKDRKGRVLSQADIDHYQQIVSILSETISLMDKIDGVIEENGGWPLS